MSPSLSPTGEPVRGPDRTRTRRAAALLSAAASCGVLALVLGARAAERAPAVRGWVADPRTAVAVVRVEDLVEVAAVALGLVLAVWFALSLCAAGACATARVLGRRWSAGERLVARYAPQVVRRALLVSAGTGLALAGAGLPAGAAVDDSGVAAELGWSPTVSMAPLAPTAVGAPEAAPTPTSPSSPPTSSPPTTASSTGSGTGTAVTVRPGDTLWDIAAAHLPAGARASDVATAWPRWYAANADVVGADPDLIRPGQQLVPPVGAAGSDGADR